MRGGRGESRLVGGEPNQSLSCSPRDMLHAISLRVKPAALLDLFHASPFDNSSSSSIVFFWYFAGPLRPRSVAREEERATMGASRAVSREESGRKGATGLEHVVGRSS